MSDVPAMRSRPSHAAAGLPSPLRESLAGAAAGGLTRTLIAPLDWAKINLQVRQGSMLSGLPSLLRERLATNGLRVFWRGNSVAVAQWAAWSAIQFPAVSAAERLAPASMPPQITQFCSAGAAAAATTVMTYPLDLLRTRLAVHATPTKFGMLHAAQAVLSQGGPFALWRGMSAALAGSVPAMGLTFVIYESVLALQGLARGHAGSGHGAVAGAAAGMATKLLLYPFDTAKKRMQICATPSGTVALGATMRGIWTHEGALGLYRGLVPGLIKVAPATALGFALYEQFCALLEVQPRKSKR